MGCRCLGQVWQATESTKNQLIGAASKIECGLRTIAALNAHRK